MQTSGARQILYIVLGLGAMAACASVDYRSWKRFAPWLYVANIALLAFVLRGGHSALGAVRWISLGPLGTFQPSEPAKVIVAIALAALLARQKIVDWRSIVWAIGLVAVPGLLILKQPDLGTTLVVGAILTAILFFAVSSLRDFLVYLCGVIGVAGFVVGTNVVLKPFQRDRLLVFLHPNADLEGAGWNLNQAKIAVGSGGLSGRGLFHGTQDAVELRTGTLARLYLHRARRRVGLSRRARTARTLRAAAHWSVPRDDRRARPLRLLPRGRAHDHACVPHRGEHRHDDRRHADHRNPATVMSYGGSAIITNFIAVGILLNMYMQRDKLEF